MKKAGKSFNTSRTHRRTVYKIVILYCVLVIAMCMYIYYRQSQKK